MQNIALILIGIGTLILIGWAAQGFFTASEIPILIRVAIGIIGIGVLALVGVAIKDRIKKSRTENFKDINK